MSSLRIIYARHSDSTREAEASALANIYSLVLDSAHKNAAGVTSTNGDDARERFKDDYGAKQNSTR